VCSLLTGRALEWATAIWRPEGNTFITFQEFTQQFRQVFEHTTGEGEAGEQLLNLTQGKETTADYALTFRTLAAQTNWVEAGAQLPSFRGVCSNNFNAPPPKKKKKEK